MDNTERRQLIESSVKSNGLQIVGWESDEEEGEGRERANLGRFVVLEDVDSTMGPFEGEEGVLYASVVGSAQHGNTRVHYGLVADGTDCPSEVDPFNLEQI